MTSSLFCSPWCSLSVQARCQNSQPQQVWIGSSATGCTYRLNTASLMPATRSSIPCAFVHDMHHVSGLGCTEAAALCAASRASALSVSTLLSTNAALSLSSASVSWSKQPGRSCASASTASPAHQPSSYEHRPKATHTQTHTPAHLAPTQPSRLVLFRLVLVTHPPVRWHRQCRECQPCRQQSQHSRPSPVTPQ